MTSTTFFIIFIPILAILLLAINLILAPHNPYQEKDSAFECGFHSFLGQNRTQFSVSFFIFGLLFLLFDLEILLVYPYSVSSYTNDIYGLVVMMVFFVLLTLGFIFELGKNALTIESRQTSFNDGDMSTPHAFISSIKNRDYLFFLLILMYGQVLFNLLKSTNDITVYNTISFLFLSICIIILYTFLRCSYGNRRFRLSYFSIFIIFIKFGLILFLMIPIGLELHHQFIEALLYQLQIWTVGTTALAVSQEHLTASMQAPNNPAIGSSSAGGDSITKGSSELDANIIRKQSNVNYFREQFVEAKWIMDECMSRKNLWESENRLDEWRLEHESADKVLKDCTTNLKSEIRMLDILKKQRDSGQYSMPSTSTTTKRTLDDTSFSNDDSNNNRRTFDR